MPVDLSSVSLPDEQANQLAELDSTSPTPEVEPILNTPEEAQETQTTPDVSTQPAAAAETTTEEPNLTPFHEHPDWKKMQEEKHELELKLARLEGRVDASQQSVKEEKLPYASVTEMAKDLMAKKKASGWEPQSAEEVAMVTQQLFEDARQAFANQDTKTQQETQQHQQQEIVNTVKELGLAADESKPVRDKLFAIAGVIDPNLKQPQRQVLKDAHRIMQMFPNATAEQVAQAASATTDAAKDTTGQENTQQPMQQTTTASTAATNKRISQGGSTGSGTAQAKNQRSFTSFKSETLDQMVQRIAAENNLN